MQLQHIWGEDYCNFPRPFFSSRKSECYKWVKREHHRVPQLPGVRVNLWKKTLKRLSFSWETTRQDQQFTLQDGCRMPSLPLCASRPSSPVTQPDSIFHCHPCIQLTRAHFNGEMLKGTIQPRFISCSVRARNIKNYWFNSIPLVIIQMPFKKDTSCVILGMSKGQLHQVFLPSSHHPHLLNWIMPWMY